MWGLGYGAIGFGEDGGVIMVGVGLWVWAMCEAGTAGVLLVVAEMRDGEAVCSLMIRGRGNTCEQVQ